MTYIGTKTNFEREKIYKIKGFKKSLTYLFIMTKIFLKILNFILYYFIFDNTKVKSEKQRKLKLKQSIKI